MTGDTGWPTHSPAAGISAETQAASERRPKIVAEVIVSFFDRDFAQAQIATASDRDIPTKDQLLRAALRVLQDRSD